MAFREIIARYLVSFFSGLLLKFQVTTKPLASKPSIVLFSVPGPPIITMISFCTFGNKAQTYSNLLGIGKMIAIKIIVLGKIHNS
jgi:hypothetical protein